MIYWVSVFLAFRQCFKILDFERQKVDYEPADWNFVAHLQTNFSYGMILMLYSCFYLNNLRAKLIIIFLIIFNMMCSIVGFYGIEIFIEEQSQSRYYHLITLCIGYCVTQSYFFYLQKNCIM